MKTHIKASFALLLLVLPFIAAIIGLIVPEHSIQYLISIIILIGYTIGLGFIVLGLIYGFIYEAIERMNCK